jgi:hypothetical protein
MSKVFTSIVAVSHFNEPLCVGITNLPYSWQYLEMSYFLCEYQV